MWSSCRYTLQRTCCHTAWCGRPRCPSSSRTCAATALETAVLLWVQPAENTDRHRVRSMNRIPFRHALTLRSRSRAIIICKSLLSLTLALVITAIANPLWWSLMGYETFSATVTIYTLGFYLNLISPSMASCHAYWWLKRHYRRLLADNFPSEHNELHRSKLHKS